EAPPAIAAVTKNGSEKGPTLAPGSPRERSSIVASSSRDGQSLRLRRHFLRKGSENLREFSGFLGRSAVVAEQVVCRRHVARSKSHEGRRIARTRYSILSLSEHGANGVQAKGSTGKFTNRGILG